MIICTKCKESKSRKDYYADNRIPKGLQASCKECCKKQVAERRNTKEYKIWFDEYKILDRTKEIRKRNHAKWQSSKKGKIYLKKYRQTEQYLEYRRGYEKDYIKRPEAKLSDQINRSKYRKKKRLTCDGTITPTSAKKLLKEQNNICNICGKKMYKKDKFLAQEIDHIIPISKGGTHSLKNIQWLCRKCNRAKSDKI